MKRWLPLLAFPLLIAAEILMILPLGGELRFLPNPDAQIVVMRYSYFDPILFGYGNLFPLPAAILTSFTLPAFAVVFVRQRANAVPAVAGTLGAVAALLSLYPYVNACNAVIASLCAAAVPFLWLLPKKDAAPHAAA